MIKKSRARRIKVRNSGDCILKIRNFWSGLSGNCFVNNWKHEWINVSPLRYTRKNKHQRNDDFNLHPKKLLWKYDKTILKCLGRASSQDTSLPFTRMHGSCVIIRSATSPTVKWRWWTYQSTSTSLSPVEVSWRRRHAAKSGLAGPNEFQCSSTL